ncbi:MAG: tRNA (adenosine(37)-N6)-threonylcarbamoyltransferase complex ATPase subunit type 1 TsaE [Candidatus Competibacteraceae bacterium]|nr:tRNA (adenosine(37)-N6)-threonylcarbamoyltransferase complex ATPase subunit type 1 TsaE [Candidatus Competibacteraceae bacterium]
MRVQFTISNIQELGTIARIILQEMQRFPLVLVQGGMGVGKTTLIAQVLKEMGCKDAVSSPTYSIVAEYHTEAGRVYHMDWYRIEHSSELDEIGIDEYLHASSPCLIEWPERDMPRLSGMPVLSVKIEQNEEIRRVEIKAIS